MGVLIGELAGQCGLDDETMAGSSAVQSGQFQLEAAPVNNKMGLVVGRRNASEDKIL